MFHFGIDRIDSVTYPPLHVCGSALQLSVPSWEVVEALGPEQKEEDAELMRLKVKAQPDDGTTRRRRVEPERQSERRRYHSHHIHLGAWRFMTWAATPSLCVASEHARSQNMSEPPTKIS